MAIIIQTAPVKRNGDGEKVDIAPVVQNMTKMVGIGKIQVYRDFELLSPAPPCSPR